MFMHPRFVRENWKNITIIFLMLFFSVLGIIMLFGETCRCTFTDSGIVFGKPATSGPVEECELPPAESQNMEFFSTQSTHDFDWE